MTPLLLILFALTGLSHGQLEASPRQFPENCESLPDGLGPGLRLFPLQDLPQEEFQLCHSVGGPCTTDKDCGKPDAASCYAADTSFKGSIRPISSRCVQGTCRVAKRRQDEACDCLVGCVPENTGFRPLSCTDGKCSPPPCAACGEKPNGLACCGSGVVGFNGVCECASLGGSGCVATSDCGGNGKCCRGGPYDGQCCSQCSNPAAAC